MKRAAAHFQTICGQSNGNFGGRRSMIFMIPIPPGRGECKSLRGRDLRYPVSERAQSTSAGESVLPFAFATMACSASDGVPSRDQFLLAFQYAPSQGLEIDVQLLRLGKQLALFFPDTLPDAFRKGGEFHLTVVIGRTTLGGVLMAQSLECWRKAEVTAVVLVKPSMGSFIADGGTVLEGTWSHDQVRLSQCALSSPA
jgi:hypothetical protein